MTIGACRIKRRNIHGYVARLPIGGKFLRGNPCSILLSVDMKNFGRINLPITWFEAEIIVHEDCVSSLLVAHVVFFALPKRAMVA